jgi:hypothetical protein
MSVPFSEPGVLYLNVSREEAESHLTNATPGSYIVRPSSRPGNLSLTYRTRDAQNKLGHLLLVREAAGWTTEGVVYHFQTVRELLMRLPYGLRLTDEQMHAAPPATRPAVAAPAGYAIVPSAAQMGAAAAGGPGSYGRVPQVGVNALAEAGGYGRAPVVMSAADSPYARALPATNAAAPAEYGRVPLNRTPSQELSGSADAAYGRVPVGASSPVSACVRACAYVVG